VEEERQKKEESESESESSCVSGTPHWVQEDIWWSDHFPVRPWFIAFSVDAFLPAVMIM
jgi:hypothetical protein